MNTFTYILLGLALLTPWIFLIILLRLLHRQEKNARETLVYLKSGSAYEAEDVMERVGKREKTIIEKGLAKMKKESENLSDEPAGDMASDMRESLQKKYDNGTGK